jgi:simple sugar transport system permease protein
MDALFSWLFLAQVLRISVPYVLAGLGGVLSERAGVVALALEGEMLLGAFASVVATETSGSPLLGLAAGLAAGALVASLVGVVSIRLRGDQIVAGVAVNLLAVGVTRYFLKLLYGSSSNSPRIEAFTAPAWADGPLLQLLTSPLFLGTALLCVVLHLVLYRTPWGLRMRAVGEHPEAAETLGVSAPRLRWSAVLFAGALAGLGGVWLAFDQHQFVDSMSGLRGYIALAAVVFGKWRPAWTTLACLLFGFAEALQIALQGAEIQLPTQLVQTLPYVLTMVTLAGVIGRAAPPGALGKPYERG